MIAGLRCLGTLYRSGCQPNRETTDRERGRERKDDCEGRSDGKGKNCWLGLPDTRTGVSVEEDETCVAPRRSNRAVEEYNHQRTIIARITFGGVSERLSAKHVTYRAVSIPISPCFSRPAGQHQHQHAVGAAANEASASCFRLLQCASSIRKWQVAVGRAPVGRPPVAVARFAHAYLL